MSGMKLQDIKAGLSLSGVEPTQIVSVVATVPQGDGALHILVDYTIRTTNSRSNMVYPFYLKEGTDTGFAEGR